jgi:ATP-binding cassette subfamily B protein
VTASAKVGDGLRIGRRLAGQLRPHLAGQKGPLAAALLMSLLVLVFRMAQPWPLKWIVDTLSHGAARLPWGIDAGAHPLTVFCAAYLAVSLFGALAEYGQLLHVVSLVNRTVAAFRSRLFLHVLRLPLAYHDKREVGELITRVVSDVARLRRGLAALALQGARSILFFLVTVAVLFAIDPRLSGLALACGLVAGARMLLRSRFILKAARKNREREGKLAAIVEDDLQGVRELQTYRADGTPDPRFDEMNSKSLKSEQKLRRLEAGLLLFVETLLTLTLCGVVWLGTKGVSDGRLTTGDLILFVSYLMNLYRPFAQFARQASKAGRTLACADRLVRIVEREPAIADRPGAEAAPPFRGEFALENVAVDARGSDGKAQRILEGLAFRVEAGQRVAILGRNGAGKSTLLRHVARLVDPAGGRILVDGRDLRDFTLASLRGQISAVYQDSALFGLSVAENIALGRPGASREEIRAAAERARVADFVDALPEQYDTVLRRRGRLISGGEQQRIALARALLRDGRIWILDEPTAGLDAVAAARLEETLLEATRGRTTFWVTHHLPTAMKLDRILYLDEAALRFHGPADEFARWARAASPDEVYLRDLAARI